MSRDYLTDYYKNTGMGISSLLNPYASRPQYDATGRIANYTGTVGGGETDSPTFDPKRGIWVSKKTGNPWSTQTTTQNSTSPAPQFDVTKTVKQPGVAAATDNLLTRYNNNSGALTKSFQDYLDQAKQLNDQSRAQLVKDQAAVDPTSTIDRLNAGAASTTGNLNDINRNYETAQRGISGEVTAGNQKYSTTVADRLAKLKSDLSSENSQYETAAQAVAGQAFDKARKQIALYQLSGGTPASGSGDLTNRYVRAYSDINVPLQKELADRRYGQTGFLNSEQSSADQQLYQNQMNELSGRSALEGDIANRDYGTAQYTGNLDAATTAQVFSLKTATAGMSRAQAADYLAKLQVPLEVGQRVLSGDISNLSNISALDNAANYYTVSTPYDNTRVPSTPNYTATVGNRNYSPQAPTQAATAASMGVPSIPPTQQLPRGTWTSGLVTDQQTANGLQLYRDPKTGKRYYVNSGQVFEYPYDNNSAIATAAAVKPTNAPA